MPPERRSRVMLPVSPASARASSRVRSALDVREARPILDALEQIARTAVRVASTRGQRRVVALLQSVVGGFARRHRRDESAKTWWPTRRREERGRTKRGADCVMRCVNGGRRVVEGCIRRGSLAVLNLRTSAEETDTAGARRGVSRLTHRCRAAWRRQERFDRVGRERLSELVRSWRCASEGLAMRASLPMGPGQRRVLRVCVKARVFYVGCSLLFVSPSFSFFLDFIPFPPDDARRPG